MKYKTRVENDVKVETNEKEIGFLHFKVPREYFDAFKVYRIAYAKKILEEYGSSDINSSFLFLFKKFCEMEKIDICLALIKDYEDSYFNAKKELREMAMKEMEAEA